MTNDQVNSGTKHSSSEGELCPRPAPSDGSLVGRELDAAVAERVMRLVPCQSDQHVEGAKFHMERPCHAQPDSPDKGSETLCYSTDIAAAMEVVEKMREWCPRVEIRTHENLSGWGCEFSTSSENDNIAEIRGIDIADTLPEAICLAALEAVASRHPGSDGEHGPTQ